MRELRNIKGKDLCMLKARHDYFANSLSSVSKYGRGNERGMVQYYV
jgi:hypothetical protein